MNRDAQLTLVVKLSAWITLVAVIIGTLLVIILTSIGGVGGLEWPLVIKYIIIAPIALAWAIRTIKREKQREKELKNEELLAADNSQDDNMEPLEIIEVLNSTGKPTGNVEIPLKITGVYNSKEEFLAAYNSQNDNK